jgi:predicted nuclease with TOPRIM domain
VQDPALLWNDKSRLTAAITNVEQENETLQGHITSLDAERTRLESRVSALEKERQDLQIRVASLEERDPLRKFNRSRWLRSLELRSPRR